MIPSDLRVGNSSSITLSRSDGSPFPDGIDPGIPVRISSVNGHQILELNDTRYVVEGSNRGSRRLLEELAARENFSKFAWFIAPSPAGLESVVIGVCEFIDWFDNFEAVFCVDEYFLEKLQKINHHLTATDRAIEWLQEQFLLHPDGQQNACVTSRGASTTADSAAFRIHGRDFSVDVKKDDRGRFLLNRITRSQKGENFLVLAGSIQFSDATIAGDASGLLSQALASAVSSTSSYLRMWDEYNREEERQAILKAREAGQFFYNSQELDSDGEIVFRGNPGERNGRFMGQAVLDLEVEIVSKLPEELIQDTEITQFTTVSGSPPVHGKVIKYDQDRTEVHVLLDHEDRDSDKLPGTGVLHLGLTGYRVNIGRRKDARDRIAGQTCEMKQLVYIIEEKEFPHRRRSDYNPWSSSVEAAYGKNASPTKNQLAAIKIALETPDIALIQGPPGTGKTRTIAALQARLADSDLTSDEHGLSHRFLLTSEAHLAVENVAGATKVYGLPAIKIDSKSRRWYDESSPAVHNWTRDKIDAARTLLDEFGTYPVQEIQKQVRTLALDYHANPKPIEELPGFLRKVIDSCQEHLQPDLRSRLLDSVSGLEREARFPASSGDASQKLALKAIRSLRTDPLAWGDDGQIRASIALESLQRLEEVESHDLSILKEAPDQGEEAESTWLERLLRFQEDWIDRLVAPATGKLTTVRHSIAEEVLASCMAALNDRLLLSPAGVDAVLHQYIEDLESDDEGVRKTLETYTAVLASTCQYADTFRKPAEGGQDQEAAFFDTVVVDEAARVNPLDLFIPMTLARRRIVLVGDHRQLPQLVDDSVKDELERSSEEFQDHELKRSLFERLFNALQKRQDKDGIPRTVTLKTQFRMHPKLAEFVSDTFYRRHDPAEGFDSENGIPISQFEHPIERYEGKIAVWVDVPHRRGPELRPSRGKSYYRTPEATWVAQETQRILENHPEISVGVIAPYEAQVDEIMKEMERLGLAEIVEGEHRIKKEWTTTTGPDQRQIEQLNVGTVDAFQGLEYDVIILSLTRSNTVPIDPSRTRPATDKYGFLVLDNRLCVAMSRQKKLLLVVGDSAMASTESASQAVPGLHRFFQLTGTGYGARVDADE
jgi:hypothetical protein